MSQRFLPVYIFLLAGLSVYVLVLLAASIPAAGPQSDVENWQRSGVVPDEQSWQDSYNSISTSLALDPANPEYLETEAKLFRAKAQYYPRESTQWDTANREALASYQHLLTLRPSWSPYWAAIVATKYDLWEFDEEMQVAMQHAATLGPWFQNNQRILLKVGYHGWYFIDLKTRKVIEETLLRAIQLQPKATILQAMQEGFLDRLEPYFETSADFKAIYDKEMKRLKREKRKRDKKTGRSAAPAR